MVYTRFRSHSKAVGLTNGLFGQRRPHSLGRTVLPNLDPFQVYSMSVVAFGFGSFGDIVTLLQIIVGTCKLLNDCYDATAQRQETIEYLFAFSNALRCLSPLCASSETHGIQKATSQLPAATINAIRHSVDKCAQEIQRFHARVQTAAPPVDARSTTGSVARIRESVHWSLSLNAESVRLRRILGEQKGLIDTILAAQMTQYVASVHVYLVSHYLIQKHAHLCRARGSASDHGIQPYDRPSQHRWHNTH